MSTRVYRYGLLAPTTHEAIVRELMFAAHGYRNTLVEVERGRRDAARALMASQADVGPLEAEAAASNAALMAVLGALKAARARTRTRSEASAQTAAVTAARAAKRTSVAALRERRATIRADGAFTARSKAIYAQAMALAANAYEHSALKQRQAWGTRALVDEAMEASRKQPLYDGSEPNDPRFQRWTGEGSLGLQVHQKGAGGAGLTVDEVHAGGAGWLAIASGEPSAEPQVSAKIAAHRARNAARRAVAVASGGGSTAERTVLRMRIGTAPDRTPIVAEWPMVMHRPLPVGAIVRRAAVSLRKSGPREEWSVEITVVTIAIVREAAPDIVADRGAVAIDLGWRKMGDYDAMTDEIRVGAWLGEDGESGEIRLPSAVISGIRKAEDLRSIRDQAFDVARGALAAWLTSGIVLPPWLVAASTHLPQWKSAARLAALCRRWSANRVDGDAEAFGALEAWRYHDHHLWSWECSQRTGALRRRREVYRVASAELARRYSTLVLEKFRLDKRGFAKRALPEADAENATARSNRQLCAPGELRLVASNAFRGRGGAVEDVPAHDTTRLCHVAGCGVVEQWDQAAEVRHRCANWHEWDQDANAAANILARWCERSGGTPEPGTARSGEDPSDPAQVAAPIASTRTTMSRGHRAQNGTAREAIGNAS
jgi:hypothetical protein